jgi:carbohydrate-selective porin OprB
MMMFNKIVLLILSFFFLFIAAPGTMLAQEAAKAEGTPKKGNGMMSLTKVAPVLTPISDYTGDIRNRFTLFGDIGGERQKLYERGVTFDAMFTQVYQGIASGGKKDDTGEYHGLFEYGVTLDTGKLGVWPGGLIVANAYTSVGNTLFEDAGNLSPVNFNALLPTPDPSRTFLMEYYLTQALPTKTIVTIGRLNPSNFLDRSRFANDRRSQFLNAAMDNNVLIGSFLSFSTYAGLVVQPVNEHLSVYGAVFDPTAAPPDYGVEGGLFSDVGSGAGGEIRWELGDGLGGTLNPVFIYSNKDTAEVDNPFFPIDPQTDITLPIEVPSYSDNWGVIFTLDQYLWKPDRAKKAQGAAADRPSPSAAFAFQEPGIGLFARFGYTPDDRNLYYMYASGGIGARGVFPSRPYDRFGIGAYTLIKSDDFGSDGFGKLADVLLEDEVGLEAYYNLALTPAVQLSFDVQWIDPGIKSTDNTVVLGTRLFIQF